MPEPWRQGRIHCAIRMPSASTCPAAVCCRADICCAAPVCTKSRIAVQTVADNAVRYTAAARSISSSGMTCDLLKKPSSELELVLYPQHPGQSGAVLDIAQASAKILPGTAAHSNTMKAQKGCTEAREQVLADGTLMGRTLSFLEGHGIFTGSVSRNWLSWTTSPM